MKSSSDSDLRPTLIRSYTPQDLFFMVSTRRRLDEKNALGHNTLLFAFSVDTAVGVSPFLHILGPNLFPFVLWLVLFRGGQILLPAIPSRRLLMLK